MKHIAAFNTDEGHIYINPKYVVSVCSVEVNSGKRRKGISLVSREVVYVISNQIDVLKSLWPTKEAILKGEVKDW